MSAATIDHRLAGERKCLELKGRSATKAGSLLKSTISIRTWVEWDEQTPGFVEFDLVVRQDDSRGEFALTLTLTDVITGWTETKAIRKNAQNWVLAVGYNRYDTPLKLELRKAIYVLLRVQPNFFSPQPRPLEKHRQYAKVTKKYA
jgi:hypothetical protein